MFLYSVGRNNLLAGNQSFLELMASNNNHHATRNYPPEVLIKDIVTAIVTIL